MPCIRIVRDVYISYLSAPLVTTKQGLSHLYPGFKHQININKQQMISVLRTINEASKLPSLLLSCYKVCQNLSQIKANFHWSLE